MKHLFTKTLVSGLLLFTANTAYCNENLYLSGNFGFSAPEDSTTVTFGNNADIVKYDVGVALGMAIGYKLDENFRVEGEIAYQHNDLDTINSNAVSGDVQSVAFLANGYFDFKNNSPFTPYIGAGIGIAGVFISNINNNTFTDDAAAFAYHVGTGVDYKLNNKFTVGLKYRFFGTSDPQFYYGDIEYQSHNVYAGISYSF